jgi:hypothetical protein
MEDQDGTRTSIHRRPDPGPAHEALEGLPGVINHGWLLWGWPRLGAGDGG